MKPGSYNVPKRDGNEVGTNNSPRAIEFLETAQNISKIQTANDRHWTNVNTSTGTKKIKDGGKNLQEMTSESELEVRTNARLFHDDFTLFENGG